MVTTIGIDIGGSSVAAVARDDSGQILGRYETTGAHRGGSQVVAAAVEAWRSLKPHDAVAVGIGVPGHVDPETGTVRLAVNLGIDDSYDLGEEVAGHVGLPVKVENDVRAAALGAHESLVLGGEVPESLAVLSIGTGISAGVVMNGTLLRGAQGMAGEVGHVVVDPSGPRCPCGQQGCLEAVAAGPAIARLWPRAEPHVAATALFTSAAGGDSEALKVVEGVTGHLTTALTWLAATYDTEKIVLAGGVTSVGDAFLSVVREQIVRRAAASELAARRLRPDQVILADALDPPGPRGAAVLADTQRFPERVSPAKQASNDTRPTDKEEAV